MNYLKNIWHCILIFFLFLLCSCAKDLNLLPKSNMSDVTFWKTAADMQVACNYLYTRLPEKDDLHGINNYSDESYGTANSNISDGSRVAPPTDDKDWDSAYFRIRAANNILEKSITVIAPQATINRYLAEARFFRAFFYSELVKRYGDVPLLMRTVNVGDSQVYTPRSPRQKVLDSVYADLDFATQNLPLPSALAATEYGRITKTAALALKSRVALFEGTRQKYFNYGTYKQTLQMAADAANAVITSGEHSLYTTGGANNSNSYYDLFAYLGKGRTNKENILVRLYGESASNNISQNKYGPWCDLAYSTPTKALMDAYLYIDGLPKDKTTYPDYPTGIDSTLAPFINRDPRAEATIANKQFVWNQAIWDPSYNAFQFSVTGFKTRKGAFPNDMFSNASFLDYQLIRYAEVLLNYAEAKYEIDGSISDANLDLTVNALRKRVGFPTTGLLTNAFVAAHALNMRDEIRRERRIELATDGMRYWDLLRWKIAETELPKDLLGDKYIAAEHVNGGKSAPKNANGFVIVQTGRKFNPDRDYLWPIPTKQIALNPNLTQNSKW